jgi:hypothetical protein
MSINKFVIVSNNLIVVMSNIRHNVMIIQLLLNIGHDDTYTY